MFDDILNTEIDSEIETSEVSTEDDVTTEASPITFSNGVVFTPEELEVMDPALKAKLLKVKGDEAQMQKGFNEKLRKLKEAQPAKPSTPAPKAENPAVNNEDPYVKQFVYGQIVDKNFNEAVADANAKIGSETVAMLLQKPEIINQLNSVKQMADVSFDFKTWIMSSFSVAITTDQNILDSFNVFKGIRSQEDIKKEQEAKKQIEEIKAKPQAPGGLPQGGMAPMEPPIANDKPRTLEEAKAKAKELFSKLT